MTIPFKTYAYAMKRHTLHTWLLALTLTLACLPAVAQVRHVTTVDPSSPKRGYIEVYEFDYVDVQPQFPGGEHGLVNFINKTREYPYDAYTARIQGRVVCSFIVGTDGRVSQVKVIRSSGNESLNREAMRVINAMPRWTAGRVGKQAVNVRCVLPIAFRL